MDKLLPFEINAINYISSHAKNTSLQDENIIKEIIYNAVYMNIDINFLKNQLLFSCDVTLNFHPDRLSNNGKMVITNLIEQGQYYSQFITGTSNGGLTAFNGGERDLWEKSLFHGTYHGNEATIYNRPKYGALNIFNYLDGASARFGSCFFTLKKHVVKRCTFAFGDSSSNPETLGTQSYFYPILRELLLEVEKKGKLLNKHDYNVKKTVDYIISMKKGSLMEMGNNLDYCIETHVHGEINLLDDIDSLYVDESFRNSEIYGQIIELTNKYGIKLFWIPERRLSVNSIGDEFRGSAIPLLAKRIDLVIGKNAGYINAEMIGKASRSITLYPNEWAELGNEFELFQNIKKLWHTVAYFG